VRVQASLSSPGSGAGEENSALAAPSIAAPFATGLHHIGAVALVGRGS
jgi:hypothetical protein